MKTKLDIDAFYSYKAGHLKSTLQGVPDWVIRHLFPITDEQDEKYFADFVLKLRDYIDERMQAAEIDARNFATKEVEE
jgi:hypothetical protein